jgi:hypothetical protein
MSNQLIGMGSSSTGMAIRWEINTFQIESADGRKDPTFPTSLPPFIQPLLLSSHTSIILIMIVIIVMPFTIRKPSLSPSLWNNSSAYSK